MYNPSVLIWSVPTTKIWSVRQPLLKLILLRWLVNRILTSIPKKSSAIKMKRKEWENVSERKNKRRVHKFSYTIFSLPYVYPVFHSKLHLSPIWLYYSPKTLLRTSCNHETPYLQSWFYCLLWIIFVVIRLLAIRRVYE